MDSRSIGAAGEVMAARFLREKGYTILSANYRCRFGEIDIIACNKQYIAFVEVKTRGDKALCQPGEAVTLAKQKRIIKTACLFLQTYPSALQPRFDVVEIIADGSDSLHCSSIKHIENAYETGDLHEAF